ncbi:hypothetical protein BT67DRAFT_150859 [Trichocladium antarcticum]|uniref:Uncharacterized protein n=1 Tax=Trichocladium antarcticum TaxID=1450529 RepID=A0AAN6UFF6_9PEZI|nr:hypothetical protein BT67DRAFT_150859 [Trichocladium antarcticum]
MPIRNPFSRRPGAIVTADENQRPGSSAAAGNPDVAHPGFERVDTVGSKASPAFGIGRRTSQDTGEYKMSVVSDSGVYLPPSPVEREATWPKRYLARTSSDRSSTSVGEIDSFPISRESFDSYRRSFDISAKSPAFMAADSIPLRQSLDSNRFSRFPRSALDHRQLHQPRRFFEREPPTPEESEKFEDVGLNDESKQQQQQQQQQQSQQQGPDPAAHPKKRGFFSKFGSDTPAATTTPNAATAADHGGTAMSRFLSGRKRAPSGQGAELGAMPDRPATALQAQEVEG